MALKSFQCFTNFISQPLTIYRLRSTVMVYEFNPWPVCTGFAPGLCKGCDGPTTLDMLNETSVEAKVTHLQHLCHVLHGAWGCWNEWANIPPFRELQTHRPPCFPPSCTLYFFLLFSSLRLTCCWTAFPISAALGIYWINWTTRPVQSFKGKWVLLWCPFAVFISCFLPMC